MEKMEVDNYNSVLDELLQSNKDDKNLNNSCIKVSKDICSSKLTVVDLVEQLRVLLIDTSSEKRDYGLLILTKVLNNLPTNFLNSDQIKFISSFYADRLKDHHQVVPTALQGILVLFKFDNIVEGCITQILQSLFQNISCQQQQLHDRYSIYQIFEKSLQIRTTEVLAMSFDFVYGVITAIDGERDPRNLLYLFSWLPKFIKLVNLGHLTEEMFEVVACYFPVDFKAPGDNINGISRDTLAQALCPCLCCIESFAQFCLPLAIEKLSSSLKTAQLDSLDLLIESCRMFSSDSFAQHSVEIWSLLEKEVLNGTDAQIVNKCLETLTHVVNKLSQSATTTDCFVQTVEDITDTVKGNLRPDTRLFQPSVKILLYLAKASEKSVDYVIKNVLPQLVNTYNITSTPLHQSFLLESMVDFTKVYVEVTGNIDIKGTKELSFIPNLCLKASIHEDPNIRKVGLDSIGEIAESIPKYLRENVYTNLKIHLTVNQHEKTRESAIKCFKNYCKLFPLEVEQEILDKISTSDNTSLDLFLDALCEVGSNAKLTEKILKIFINSCTNCNDLIRFSVVLKNLKKFLLLSGGNESIYAFLLSDGGLINFIIDLLCRKFDETSVQKFETLLKNVIDVLENIVAAQDTEVQRAILEKYLNPAIVTFRDTKNSVYVILFHGLLCRLKKDLAGDYGLIGDLCEATLQTDNDFVFEFGARLIANLINKLDDEKAVKYNLKVIESCIEVEKIFHKRNVILFSWVIKALIMRGHEYGSLYTNKLINMLESCKDAPLGFELIMSDSYNCLSSESNCNRRLLYRQKFFTDVIKQLCKEEKQQYLLAVGYLLKESPKQVVLMHFKKLLKSIVLCLEKIDDSEILCSILGILFSFLESKETIFEDYIDELVPRFLSLSRFQKSMKVRIKALQCLQAYAIGFTLHKLLHQKQPVVHELEQCLDDPKRMVRKEAVLARNCWFLLDTPT
ncbi:MMS19 nucleotide excision repair protein homolog [Agrilus planipennis]|uniref:MMS19 nucleotide excision repair protein n=1 Tax=Agrilus planipennis TaxID=224129 RepID=A0A7F5R452_AGRPL|nr:MMS19 nucleotide excision repair protein homolog [Agrilus planipennis]